MEVQAASSGPGNRKAGGGRTALPDWFWITWALLPVLILLLYRPILPDLIHTWDTDPDNAHGILVPFLTGWLIWRKRKELAGTPVRPWWPGLAGTLLSLLLYALCYLGDVAVGARASLVLLIYTSVLLTLGREFERKLRFPLLFLLFMVPVPDSLKSQVAFPLQLFASWVSASLLNLFGIVVVREGNVLHLRETSLEVAAACSGIRSMVSYLMLGIFFSYVSQNRKKVTILLISLSIPIALAANVARVTLSGFLAEWFGPETAEGFLHEASGLIMFAFGFVIFLALNHFLNRVYASDEKRTVSPVKEFPSRGTGAVADSPPPARHKWLPLVVVLLLLVAGNIRVLTASTGGHIEIVDYRLQNMPIIIGDWTGRLTHFPDEQRINRILGVDISFLRIYKRGEDQVELYVGYYGTEQGGRSSHNPESCYVGAGWSIDERGVMKITPKDRDRPVAVNHLVVESGERRQEMLHWYQVGGDRVVQSGLHLNLLRFWRRVTENRNDGAFIRVTSTLDPERPERALQLVREFSAEVIPLFPDYWPEEREVQSNTATNGGQDSR
jgi:exosortase D (VPLPA-CTERM-specific)